MIAADPALCALADKVRAAPDVWPLANLKSALLERLGPEAAQAEMTAFWAKTEPVVAGGGVPVPLLEAARACRVYSPAMPVALPGALLPGGRRSPAAQAQARSLALADLGAGTVWGRSGLRGVTGLRGGAGGMVQDQQGDEGRRYATRPWFDPLICAARGEALLWHVPRDPALHLAQALDLTGVFAPGWGHAVMEFAPQLLLAQAAGLDPGVPVIVDAGLAQSHYDLLAHLAPDRVLIRLGFRQGARVDRLWAATAPEFWPVLRAPGQRFAPGLSSLNPAALAGLLGGVPRLAPRPGDPRRVFLARTGRHVRLADQEAVAERMAQAGFVTLTPETLPLAEQLRLVQNATHVAGAAGSQMLLAMLMGHPDLAMVQFHAPDLEETPALTALAEARGQRVLVVPGQVQSANAAMPYNDLYRIGPEAVARALDWLDTGRAGMAQTGP